MNSGESVILINLAFSARDMRQNDRSSSSVARQQQSHNYCHRQIPVTTATNFTISPPESSLFSIWNATQTRQSISHIPKMVQVTSQSFTRSDAGTKSSGWSDEMGAGVDQLFIVSTYTDFERLGEFTTGSSTRMNSCQLESCCKL